MKTLLPLLLSLVAAAPLARADSRDRDYDRRDRRNEPRVILYADADYRGASIVLYPGDGIDNMSGKSFDGGGKLNDSISSIRIEGNVDVYVYADARFRGDALRVTESARDLTGRFISGSAGVSWNDRISSIKVERARGNSGGSRGPDRHDDRNDREKFRGDPDKAVKTIFLEVLGRDPGANEARDFKGRLLHEGWNERMLRDHLRTEEHYRVEAADRIIKRAFLDLFGRDVDARALGVYRRNMLERNWTESDVRDDLRKSPEYRARMKN